MMRKSLLLAVLLFCRAVSAQQVEVSHADDFQSYRPQASPIGWEGPFTTAADPLDAQNIVFGTTDSFPNGSFTTLTTSHFGARFEYRGRMLRTHDEARLGISFFSAQPERDAYYLISLAESGGGKRRSVRSEAKTLTMRLVAFGGAAPAGTLDSEITPEVNRWYEFAVETDEFSNATHIRAKFWPSGTPEPAEWQIEAKDTAIWRLNAGRIGLWSSIRGDVWFDDLVAKSWRADQAPPEIRFFDADTQGELHPSKLALYKKPARIEVRVTGAEGAVVKLDGATYAGGPIATDGIHEITAEAGFVSASLRLLVDQVPPVIAVLANGTALADGNVFDRDVTLDAKVTDVSRVTVTSTIGALPMPVAEEAAHAITITAVDQVGWESTATANFTVDKTAPLITILGNGLPFLGGHTFNQDVTLTWSATDATLQDVTATLDGNPIQSGAVVSAAAAHAVIVTATDRAGHSTRQTRNFVLRKEAAEVRLLANGAPLLEKTYGTAVTLTAEILDPTPTTYIATLDGEKYTLGTAIPREGLHTFTITVKNGAELETTVGPVTFTVDTTGPVLELSESGTAFSDGLKFNRDVLPQLAARDNLTASPDVTLFVDGREYTIGASIVEERAAHTISATATDDAGHVTSIGPFRFMLDKTRPVVTIVSPSEPDALFSKPVQVEVDVQDLTPTTTAATIGGSPVDITVPITINGTHQLSVVATDAVGWTSEPATIGFSIDTLAPQIRFTAPTADASLTTPTVDITGFADDAISITINGRAALVDEVNRTFAVQGVPLAEGRNDLVAIATDRAGNSSNTPLALHLDTRAPELAVTSPTANACLDATSIEVRGTVSDRAIAKVTANGVDATIANGAFTATVPFPSEGQFVIAVEATDAAGHAATLNVPVTIDRTAPAIEISENAGAFTATLLNRPTALFATVTDAGGTQSTTVTLNGQTYTAGTLITADRVHELKVVATDCAGHSSTKTVTFEIDRTPPSILTFAPASGSSQGAKPRISGTTSPDAATIRVEPGSTVHAVTNAAFSIDAPLVNGANELRFIVTDRAGNSAEQLYRLTLDLTTPAVEITENGAPIPANTVFARDVTPVIRATERDATIDAKLNGNPFVSGTAVTAGGAYTLTATATDAHGHTSAPATATFTIDRTGPAIAITSPAGGARVDVDRVEVRGTISGDDVQAVSVNGVPATIASGVFLAMVPIDFGGNLIIATAVDRAGNAASDQIEVTRGGGPLGILLTAPYDGMVTNRATTVVSGQLLTAAPDAKVTINGVEVPVDAAGFFRKTGFTLTEGENTITARVVSGGGESNQTSVRVTADLTPPRVRVLESGQPLAEGARFADAAHISVETSEGTAEMLVDSDQATTPVTIDEDGGHTIVATARDAAGNEARVERTIFIGVAGAAGCRLENFDPANGAVVTSNTVTISGRCGGALGVKVNGTPAVVSNGSFCATVELPNEGDNVVTIRCTDAGGTPTGDPQTLVLRRATSDPSIAFSTPGEGSVSTSETIAVSGTASGASTVEVNGAPATFTNGNWSASSVRLSAGLNVIVARARNAAGRTTAVSRRVVYLKDAPSVTISSPASALITGTNRIDVTGGWSNIDPATLTVNGTAATVKLLGDTNGTYAAPEVPLLSGDNTVTVSARDAAGRIVNATVSVHVTAGYPAIAITEPADNAVFGFESPETFTVRGTFTAVAGSTLEVAGEAAVIDGSNFTATVRHAAGRVTPVLARVTTPDGTTGIDSIRVTRLAARPEVLEHFPTVNAVEVDSGAMPLVLFSQPMDLATTAAAFRLENAAGSPVNGTIRLDRDVLTFAPAALLTPGERYTIRVATTAKSIAGDTLGTALATSFTVASSAGAVAPTLAPIPAGCAQLANISGTAPANARLRIDLGTLTFTTTANASGAWVYQLPVGGYSGYQVVRVRIAGSDGSLSPAAESCFLVDCAGPQVVSANYDRAANRVTINFSKDIKPSTVTNSSIVLRLADNRVIGGTLAVSAKTVTVTPSEDLTQKTFTLDVTTAVEDTGGTRLSFPYAQTFTFDSDAPPPPGDGSGFMSGEVFDAETGRPLAGASVFIDVTPTAIVTDARGRYAAQLPEGAHTLRVSATGYTTVWRQIVIPPGAGVIPIDIRLTPTSSTPARGPSIQSVADATFVDAQSLPGLLPLGWSPLAAAVVRTAGDLEFTVPSAEITAAAQVLTAVRYHDDRDEWRVLIAAANITDGKVTLTVDEPGAYALVYPDRAPDLARPPTPTAGAVLTGVTDPCAAQQPSNPATQQPCPPLEANSFTLDPPLVLPTGKTVATLKIKGAAPHNFPSGTAVQAYIDEELRLADGSRVTDPPFTTDLLLYRNLAGTLGVAEFRLGPSPRAAQVILDIGFNHIRILPYPGRLDRGTLVGPEGGRVPGDGRVTVEIPAGATAEALRATSATLDDFSSFGSIPGFTIAGGFTLTLQLARTVTLPESQTAGAPELLQGARATFPNIGAGQYILVEVLDGPRFRLAAQMEAIAGGRATTKTIDRALLPVDGVIREGRYLLLKADAPIAFATGILRDPNGLYLRDARITAPPLGVTDVTRVSGTYAIPVPATPAAPFRLIPSTQASGDGAAYTHATAPAADAVVRVDLTLQPQAPRLVSTEPASNASEVALTAFIKAHFDADLDPTSIVAASIVVTDTATQQNVAADVLLESPRTVLWRLRGGENRLAPNREYAVTIAPTIRGANGAPSGRSHVFRFSTVTQVASGDIHPERIRITIPDANGRSRVIGAAGALPSEPDASKRYITLVTRRGVDFLTPFQATANADGSFTIDIAETVELTDLIDLQVLNSARAVAAIIPLTPFITEDGRGFVAPVDRDVTFHGEFATITVSAGSFDVPTLVTTAPAQKSDFTAVPNFESELNFHAGLAITFDGIAKKPLEVDIPIPAGTVTDGKSFFLGRLGDSIRGPRIEIDDTLIVSGGNFTTREPAGSGLRIGANSVFTGKRVKDYLMRIVWGAGRWSVIDLKQPVGFVAAAGIEAGHDMFWSHFQSLYCSTFYMTAALGRAVFPVLAGTPFTVEGVDSSTGQTTFRSAYDGLVPPAAGTFTEVSSPVPNPTGPYPVFARPMFVQLADLHARDAIQVPTRGLQVVLPSDSGEAVVTRTGAAPAELAVLNPRSNDFSPLDDASPRTIPAAIGDRLVVYGSAGDVEPTSRLELVFNEAIAANASTAADFIVLEQKNGSTWQTVPVDYELDSGNRRVWIVLRGELQRGGEYRILIRSSLADVAPEPKNVGADILLPFNVRKPHGDLLGGPFSIPDGSVRDMALDGNLLLVSASEGDLLAYDVSNPAALATRPPVARASRTSAAENPIPQDIPGETWAVVVDAHGRIWTTAQTDLHGVIRSYRVEDFAKAPNPGGTPIRPVKQIAASIVSWRPGATSNYPIGTTYAIQSDRPEAIPRRIQIATQDQSFKAVGGETFLTGFAENQLNATAAAAGEVGEFKVWNITIPRTPDGDTGGEHYRSQRVTVRNDTAQLRWSADIIDPATGVTIPGVLARPGDRLTVLRNVATYGVVALLGYGIGFYDLNAIEHNRRLPVLPADDQHAEQLALTDARQYDFLGREKPPCDESVQAAGQPCGPHALTFTNEAVVVPGTERFDVFALETRKGLLDVSVGPVPGAMETQAFNQAQREEHLAFSGSFPSGGQVIHNDHPRLVKIRNRFRDAGRALNVRFTGMARYDRNGRSYALIAAYHFGILVVDLSPPLTYQSLADVIWIPAGAFGVRHIAGTHYATAVDGEGRSMLIDLSRIDERGEVPEIDILNCPMPCNTLMFPTVTKATAAGPDPGSALRFGTDDPRIIWKSAPDLDNLYGTLAPVADPDTGFIFSGDLLEKTVHVLSGLDPRMTVKARVGGGALQPVTSVVPLGLEPPAGNHGSNLGAMKIEVALPGSLSESFSGATMKVSIESEILPGVKANKPLPGWPDAHKDVELHRVITSTDPALRYQKGWNYFTSPWIVALADPRASEKYTWPAGADKAADGCYSCDRPAALQNDDSVIELLSAGRTFLIRPDPAVFAGSPYAYLGQQDRLTARITTTPVDTVRPKKIEIAPMNPPVAVGAMQETYYVHSGELETGHIDLIARGRAGVDAVVDRNYRSRTIGWTPFGDGWDSRLFQRIRQLPTGDVEYRDGVGNVWLFRKGEGLTYTAPAGLYLKLQSNDTGWQVIDPLWQITKFDRYGRMIGFADRFTLNDATGNRFQYSYDAQGRLSQLVDPVGRVSNLLYWEQADVDAETAGAFAGMVRSFKDWRGREVLFEYDGSGRLVKVKLPESTGEPSLGSDYSFAGDERPRVEYSYESAAGNFNDQVELRPNLSSIKDPVQAIGGGNPRVEFAYDSGRRDHIKTEKSPLIEECGGGGSCGVATFSYASDSTTVVDDLLGQKRTYALTDPALHDKREHLSSVIEHDVPVDERASGDLLAMDRAPVSAPTGVASLTTSFAYDGEGQVTRIGHPNGLVTTYTYEPTGQGAARQRIKTIEEAAGSSIITSYEYHTALKAKSIAHTVGRRDTATPDVPEIVRMLPTPFADESATGLKPKVTDNGTEVTTEYDQYGRQKLVKRTAPGTETDPATQKTLYYDAGADVMLGRPSDILGGSETNGTRLHIEYEAAPGRGEKITVSDPLRDTETIELRDAYDRVIARTVKGSESEVLSDEKFGYDAEGRLLLHVRNQTGVGSNEVRTTYDYDDAGRLIETAMDNAHVAGSATTVKTKTIHHLGNRTITEYAAYTSSPGLFTITQTDPLGRPERIETQSGGETLAQRFGYDKAGNTVFRTDTVRGAALQQFDAWSRPVLALRSDGMRSRNKWNAWGEPVDSQVLSAIGAPGESAELVAQTAWLYSTHGRQRGTNETIEGNIMRSTRNDYASDGRTEVLRVGRTSALAPEVDPAATRRTSRTVRDAAGRVESQSFGEGSFNVFTRVFGRTTVTAFTGGVPQTIRHEEPIAGASYETSTFTDGLGRLTKLHEAGGSYISTTSYDEAGNPISSLPAGYTQAWSQKYDSRGLLVEANAPEGRTVKQQYDALGNPLLYLDEDSQTTTYDVDGLGRVHKTVYEDGTSEEVVYEKSTGQVAAMKNRANVWRSFFYDAGGRVLEERLGQRDPDPATAPSGTPWRKYIYDRGGRLREVRSKDAALQYDEYDLLGRPSITRSLRFKNATGFAATPDVLDAHTQRHAWSIFDGERDRYRLPAAGMSLPADEDPGSPWRNWVVEEHDAAGNIVRLQAGDAVIATAEARGVGRLEGRNRFYGTDGHLHEGFGYADGDSVPGAAPGPASGLLGRFRAEFNLVAAAGSETLRDSARRAAIINDLALEPRRSDFGYDNRGRLKASSLLRSADSGSLTTDSLIHSDFRQARTVTTAPQDLAELGSAASRVLPPSWTATKNDVHQIVARMLSNESSERVYGFEFGRRTSDGRWTSEYDDEGRLISISRGTARIRYIYDPNGRIVGRSAENVTNDSLPAETTWVWDPIVDRLLAIYESGKSLGAGASADAGLVRQYIHGDQGYDDPVEVSLKQPDGTVARYLPIIDYAGTGSVQAILNATTSKLAERILYADAYGDAPRYLHGAVVEKISLELRKDAQGNVAEAKIRVRLSEAVDEATVPTSVRVAALTADNAVAATATPTPTLEDAHTVLLTVSAVDWTTLTTAPSATQLEIAVTDTLRATLWDGPVMPLPDWMLDTPSRASTPTQPVIQRESLSALAEFAGVGAGGTQTRTMLEVRGLYLVASGESRVAAGVGFKAAPFVEPATGLSFFRNRWYDPATGGFLTPDPVGYSDSSSLYVFAQADPVNGSDPLGLWDYNPAAVGHAIFRGAEWLKWQVTDLGTSQPETGIGFIDAGNRAVNLAMTTTINTGIDLGAGLVGGFFTIGERSGEAIGDYDSATPWRSGGRVVLSVGLDALATVGYAMGIASVSNRLINAASEALIPSATFDISFTLADEAEILGSLAPRITSRMLEVQRMRATIDAMPNPFVGMRQASAFLRMQGVGRADRVRILQSFEGTDMIVRTARANEFGIRYMGGKAGEGGAYLFDAFPASRGSLAIKPDWSTMTGMRQWRIRPGATIIEGRAAAQGGYLPGGQMQKYVYRWWENLIKP